MSKRHTLDDDLNTAKSDMNTVIVARIPAGVIVMWSGAANAIPSGWALCNGSNGTPDLRNRFIVGAGDTYAVGASGGASTHSHSDHSYTPAGTNSQPTFTGAALTGHVHDISTVTVSSVSAGTPAGTSSAPTLTMNSFTPAGTVAAIAATASSPQVSVSLIGVGTAAAQTHTHPAPAFTGTPATLTGSVSAPTFTGSALGAHTHAITGNSGSTSGGTPAGTVSIPAFTGTGATLTHSTSSHLPPYYALCFIIKT